MTTSTQSLGSRLPGADSSGGRFARLTTAVGRLRTRATTGRLDRWLLVVGGLLMPLGVMLILLGWTGAAHTPLQFEQTPYLISGGILGLALVVAGGFIYFAYWETTRIRESREQSAALLSALERVETLLTQQAEGTGTRVVGGFVATPNGSIFHRPDCTVVVGRTDLSNVDPARTKLEPCRICNPLDDAGR